MGPRWLLACGLALCLLGTAIAVAAALSDHVVDEQARMQFAGPTMPPRLPAADFTLADQDGRRVKLSDTRGRVVVLTFLHSGCHSTCPVSVQTIRGALDDLRDQGLPADDVDVFALSVDPDEDTRANVKRFVRTQHADEFLRYLTGTRAQMKPIWKKYAVRPQGPGKESHSAYVMLVDREGIVRIGFPSHLMTPEDLANDLSILLAEDVRT
jgi:protein SCO1/2